MSPFQIKTLLDQKREAFSSFNKAKFELLHAYSQAWLEFSSLSLAQQLEQLAPHPSPTGSQPLESSQGAEKGIIPFFFAESAAATARWSNREESALWVQEVLADITTFGGGPG
ncbi:MAG: NurA domain-containing protein, partial [Leptolyngbyaceae cyanobacterium SM2_5_2]|nr:NurA domain-containing protein [Leptolyngbyaceae cyanobacterium SM2_5_2]